MSKIVDQILNGKSVRKVICEGANDTGLYSWVERNNIKTPIKLEIKLKKVASQGMSRYMQVFIDGHDVTQMVANAVNMKMSNARDTYGCLIIRGVGMDMAFALQNRVYKYASMAGYPDMFDKAYYTLVK